MDDKYIEARKAELQAEYDVNDKNINELNARQAWLRGAFAELARMESEKNKPAEPKKEKK